MSDLKAPNVYPYLKRAFVFYMLIVLSIVIVGCHTNKRTLSSDQENQGWEMVKADKAIIPSWTIYKRDLAGTNFQEYKIEGGIKAPPAECAAAFRQDILNQAANLENRKYPTYQIIDQSDDCLLTYVIHNEPFPFKNTEMSVRYTFSNENGSTEVRWKEAWDQCDVPPSRKLKRVETFRGSWKFSSTLDRESSASNSVQFDPKKMPMWLVEPMVVKFLKGGLQELRETTTQ